MRCGAVRCGARRWRTLYILLLLTSRDVPSCTGEASSTCCVLQLLLILRLLLLLLLLLLRRRRHTNKSAQ